MKKEHKVLLEQMKKFALESVEGKSVKEGFEEYAQLPTDLSVFIKCLHDYHERSKELEEELVQIRSIFFQLIIVAYRECRKNDKTIADTLAYSLVRDYPDIEGSALIRQWTSLTQASIAFKEVINLKSKLLAWQQTKTLVHSSNEFLDRLLSYLIISWRCAKNKKLNSNVFHLPYGSKLDQFIDLTGGEDGPFYLICRIAQPKIRNAIAHEDIFLDSESEKITYINNEKKGMQEYTIDLNDFMAFASVGSHIPELYLASIAAIMIWNSDDDKVKAHLPKYLVKLLTH